MRRLLSTLCALTALAAPAHAQQIDIGMRVQFGEETELRARFKPVIPLGDIVIGGIMDVSLQEMQGVGRVTMGAKNGLRAIMNISNDGVQPGIALYAVWDHNGMHGYGAIAYSKGFSVALDTDYQIADNLRTGTLTLLTLDDELRVVSDARIGIGSSEDDRETTEAQLMWGGLGAGPFWRSYGIQHRPGGNEDE